MHFIHLINVVLTLFLLMVAGYIAGKFKIIDEIASKRLSKIILTIGQPCLIISSLLKEEYSTKNLTLGLTTLVTYILIHIVMWLIAFSSCMKFKDFDERKLSEFSIIFGNVGFIGFPILNSLFGAKGLFMGAFIVVGFNLLVWTLGIYIISRRRDDIKITPKKIFINFGTIPCLIGLILFILNLDLPDFIASTTTYLGNLCTPLSTLIIGALLSRGSLKKVFAYAKIYYVSAIKLIVLPLIICIVLKILGLNNDFVLFMTAVCSMPSATMVSMFAETYNMKPEFSARNVCMSSVLSILTMPFVIKIAEIITNI